jgi:hypothetical protein
LPQRQGAAAVLATPRFVFAQALHSRNSKQIRAIGAGWWWLHHQRPLEVIHAELFLELLVGLLTGPARLVALASVFNWGWLGDWWSSI